MDGQKSYRVRDGAELAHAGDVLVGGAAIQLKPEIAYEVRHLVEPIGDDGKVLPWGDAAAVQLEAELATAKPHERISILERALEANAGDRERLQKMHAIEVKRNVDATKALEQKGKTSTKPDPKTPAAAQG